MTVDQAQQLREKVIACRDELGIPAGQIALEVALDLPATTSGLALPGDVDLDARADRSLGLRMPV